MIEYLIPLFNIFSKIAVIRYAYKNVVTIHFLMDNSTFTIMIPTEKSNFMRNFVAKFNFLQSSFTTSVRFEITQEKKNHFLQISVFAKDENTRNSILSTIKFIN